jgi:hypothetical protein
MTTGSGSGGGRGSGEGLGRAIWTQVHPPAWMYPACLIADQRQAPGAPAAGQQMWTADQLWRVHAELKEAANDLRADRRRRPLRPAVSQPDADGCDLKPDPALAHTPAALMDTVRAFRAWAGNPSYRSMAAAAGARIAHSTLHAALNSSELPDLFMLKAIITGCDGTAAEVAGFISAWRRLTMRPPARG